MLQDFLRVCQDSPLDRVSQQLVEQSISAFSVKNGNIPKWNKALTQIGHLEKSDVKYIDPYVTINLKQKNTYNLNKYLKQLIPWRKGPFQLGDIKIDSEWNGDIKWKRISPHIKSLENRTVLDVGSGNGYFTLRMALSKAKIAIGIDPFLLFNYQFQALRSLMKSPPNAFVLPLRLEQLPDTNVFDSVFSMGVLYHQKDHMNHLRKLKKMLKDDGELILETLIIEDDYEYELVPDGRYARMRNVSIVPSIKTLYSWLTSAGFSTIKLVSVNQTIPEEQRSTPWIGEDSASLIDFLDPNNNNLTIEGYPAPKRAVFICRN